MTPLEKANSGGFLTKLGIYTKLSGPGWIQAAVTLGGGSLVGALYLGVIGGYEFLWLQPLAMLCGIIMLSAISYVTLSTKERPFRVVEKKVSPSLAWGWLIATVIADVVFCAAQFALGEGAIRQNLGLDLNPYVITGSFFIISLCLLAISQKDGKASRILDNTLKGLVAVIVLAFMGVVATLSIKGAVNWGHLFSGLIPDFSALFKPTAQIDTAIQATGKSSGYWTEYVTSTQRNKIIAAFGTAVGINMTFLLPYTLRKKGWGKEHRELSRFDLVLGLFVPFVLGASALVISSAASFHAKSDDILSENGKPIKGMEKVYHEVLDKRLIASNKNFKKLPADEKTVLREAVPLTEKKLAAMLAKRDSKSLAKSLEPFLGKNSQTVFGIGVLAMALSTMLVHMMMNGYAISEAFNKVGNGKIFMLGAAMPALSGLLSPLFWDGASKAALLVPAAIIATTLLPIAYLAFFLLMNSKSALGDEMPKRRGTINVLMIIAMSAATFASIWSLYHKGVPGILGMAGLGALALIGILGFIKRNNTSNA